MERINKSSGELQREIHTCENVVKDQQEQIEKSKADEEGSLTLTKTIKKMESNFNKRMDKLETKVEETNQKLKDGFKPERKTYAGVTKEQLESQSKTIKRMFDHEKSEKRWIKETACNLIIHRLSETTDNTKESQEKRDKQYLEKCVFRQLGVGFIKIQKTERIGTFTEERQAKEQYRPLKITFHNEDDKSTVLEAFCNGNYFVMSVTEDLSRSERDLVKEWCCKAKEKNKEKDDESFTWKVRGSPRSGLYLKKIYCT